MGMKIDDSNYYDINKLEKYNDTLKVVRPTVVDRLQWEVYLNSLYGKLVSCIHFTYGKENKDANATTRT